VVAKALAIIAGLEVLCFADIRPDFVALNAAAIQIGHLLIVERGTARPYLDHQSHDRIPVRVGHTLD
jgi:hypothetical protein